MDTMAECTGCHQELPRSEFYADRNKRNGLKSRCKVCHNKQAREWQDRNSVSDKARKRQYQINRRQTDPEFVESQREALRAWQRANRVKVQRWNRERRAHQRESEDIESVLDYQEVLAADPCVYCGAPTEAIDHIHPYASGGVEEWHNLTSACKRCNSRKNAKPLLRFLLEEMTR